MRYIELEGSCREIGRQHGYLLAHEIRRSFERYCLRPGKTPDKLHPSIRRYVETNLPDVAEEIEGLAEGAGLTYAEMLLYNHFNVVGGCTPLFFRESDVGPLVAQNLDCEAEEQQGAVVRRVRPRDGLAYLCVSFPGVVWAGNFINEAGIAEGAVSAHHVGYRTEDGTSVGIAARAVAPYASSLDEAFAIKRRHRNLGKVGVHLMADDRGNAVFVEGSADEKFCTRITDDFAFTTGLFTTGRVRAQDEPDYIRPKIARAKTIEDLHRAGRIEFSLAGMKQLLAHHAPDPGSVCRHNPREGLCTQSARIIILRRRTLLITDGPSCRAPYQEFQLKG